MSAVRVLKVAVGVIALVVLMMNGETRTALAIVAIATMLTELDHWTNERKKLK